MPILLLPIAAIAATLEPVDRAHARAIVTIRVERPAIANEKEWRISSPTSRREMIRLDEHGQPMLLRVIEYE